ncbi:MAG: hypothetical protein HUU21_15110 [Polyangiaceae bacterium]|nr:hypothetical protein [Polyangiaceae bacterium]
MNELSPRVRSIVEAGRKADDPTGEDRARVRGAVLRAIAVGAPAALGAATAHAAKGGAGAGTKMVGSGFAMKVGGAIGVAALAGVGFFAAATQENAPALRAEEELMALAASIRDLPMGDRAAKTPAEAPAPEEPEPPNLQNQPPNPQNQNASPRASKGAPASSLEEETKRLREVHKALRSGAPERALELLSEQSAAFASGELREERAAARVVALCKLGRTEEARAVAESFLRENPRSLLADRVRAACPSTPAP